MVSSNGLPNACMTMEASNSFIESSFNKSSDWRSFISFHAFSGVMVLLMASVMDLSALAWKSGVASTDIS